MTRSATALPVGRPTGAKVCSTRQVAGERFGVAAGVLGAVVAAEFEAVGDVGGVPERGPQSPLDGREHGAALLALGDVTGQQDAVAAVDHRHDGDEPVLRVQTVVRSVAHRRFDVGTATVPRRSSLRIRPAAGGARASP